MKEKSDPGLVEAYRRQLAYAKTQGTPPELVYLAWRGQSGITEEDLIDGLKLTEEPE